MLSRKTFSTIAVALTAFLFAFLSYQYLALALFSLGLSRFYDVAPTVPEQCTEVVADAAVAFTGIFDYISLVVAAALLILALYLTWRAFSLRTT
ncbi:hypothetical protein A2704_01405 [Candidatus Kaiserbacteria bacterium RIFCSPHIGHO2_01_FULL_54_36b]|uniref:Uncharacterized protein n=1 Tax=Candidatus Kaiserbacteria bacterium RIFCSPHIGHO2_01_FULL_54_36b TaxID=1798483 RepID=A0A1F6CJ24_9BACT|nr:MAG: hypothetical protein A2704_01405 [Candidatus Kaiserbacteria bacterium RIFCSPHIGHO2_01_FULL_54_36b]